MDPSQNHQAHQEFPAKEIARLARAVEKSNRYGSAFGRGILFGVGSAIGATIIAGAIAAFGWQLIKDFGADDLLRKAGIQEPGQSLRR